MMAGYEFHELANIFTLPEGKGFDELTADIKGKRLIPAYRATRWTYS